MTKVPLEEHVAHPLRTFMVELYHTREERYSVQTIIGLCFINEPCRYFLKFCPNIKRTSCLQIGQLPLPYLAISSRVQCAGQTPHGHYLLNHTITSDFQ